MRIAQIAPLYESVPPRGYGGTERVVAWLTEELVRRGHRVTLFATGDSRTSAQLVAVVPQALRPRATSEPVIAHVLQVGMVQRRASEFDVVHSHVEHLAFPAFREQDPPLLSTLHGRLDVENLDRVCRQFRHHPLVSISDAQRAPMPSANWLATVHHGLPVDEYPFSEQPEDYLLFLGRMSPEKRPDVAIDVARRAGARLLLAAKVDPADDEYFEEVVRPLLQEPGIDYLGEVDQDAKVRLLARARGLLFPILWPEPFGLVMIEAMACGAPVVARRCGSVDEIVTHGRTGFICDDDAALVRAIEEIDTLDRAQCRRRVLHCFSIERMVTDYERLYRRLAVERKARRPALPAPGVPGVLSSDSERSNDRL